MLVYRIVKHIHAPSLYAPGISGRWNYDGEFVIYTSESKPVALLENLANRLGQGSFMSAKFSCMTIEVPDNSIQEVPNLPNDWGLASSYGLTQPMGSEWYQARNALLLKVPSAPAPGGINYVLNTTHPLFSRVMIIKTEPYPIDPRFQHFDTLIGKKK